MLLRGVSMLALLVKRAVGIPWEQRRKFTRAYKVMQTRKEGNESPLSYRLGE